MTNTLDATRQRYHKIDGWRGYWMPPRAIAGATDTGSWEDSPAPTTGVLAELAEFKSFLRKNGIRFRTAHGTTSNVFAMKHWITVVDIADFGKAAQLTVDYLDSRRKLSYLHDADLDKLGFTPNPDREAVEAGVVPVPVTELPESYFEDVD